MITREDYNKHIEDMRTALGDDFAKISSIVATLSTDYDTVIQADSDYKQQIENIKAEKVQLLETNNKLFTQVTNTNKEVIDENTKGNPNETGNNENNSNEVIKIENVINDSGDLE